MKKQETVRAILVKAHVDPKEIVIPNDYRFWQKLVGGLVQCIYPFDDSVAVICNDEGKLLHMEPNRNILGADDRVLDTINGDFLIFNYGELEDDTDGEFIDMTDKQVAKYLDYYSQERTKPRYVESDVPFIRELMAYL